MHHRNNLTSEQNAPKNRYSYHTSAKQSENRTSSPRNWNSDIFQPASSVLQAQHPYGLNPVLKPQVKMVDAFATCIQNKLVKLILPARAQLQIIWSVKCRMLTYSNRNTTASNLPQECIKLFRFSFKWNRITFESVASTTHEMLSAISNASQTTKQIRKRIQATVDTSTICESSHRTSEMNMLSTQEKNANVPNATIDEIFNASYRTLYFIVAFKRVVNSGLQDWNDTL